MTLWSQHLDREGDSIMVAQLTLNFARHGGDKAENLKSIQSIKKDLIMCIGSGRVDRCHFQEVFLSSHHCELHSWPPSDMAIAQKDFQRHFKS